MGREVQGTLSLALAERRYLPQSLWKDLTEIANAPESLAIRQFAFTGPAAANVRAPFIDLATIDVYLTSPDRAEKLKDLAKRKGDGPSLRFLEPQAYLDLNVRGGRDRKQADYLFEKAIEPMWKAS